MRRAHITVTPEGLYCAEGDFHIDPWRPVPRAVITHGHGDHARSGSGEYHSTPGSVPILRWRLGADVPAIAHAHGEPFELGGVRVSLHPAGHVLGSAQVRIESGDQVTVVSGDYKRDPDPTCAPFEVVPCDSFITEATFALPLYRWQPTPLIAAEIIEWWDECAAAERTALLYCYSLGKAQRLAAEIHSLDARPVLLHGAMLPGFEIYRAAGVALPDYSPVPELPKRNGHAGALVLAPPSAGGSTWMRRFTRPSTAFASGWMQLRGNRRRRGHDRGFVVSDHADWPSLLRTIEDCGAKEILATHGNSDHLIRYLQERGVDAQALETAYGGED